MHAHHGNRAHKNGCLLVPEMISEAIFAGGAMFLSISIAMSSSSSSSSSSGGGDSGPSRVATSVVIAFLLGSLFLTLLCHAFASIADAWYAVGSGQFHMISLDTVGMMLYFVLPAGILQMRFLDMYAGRVASMWTAVAGGYSRFVYGVVLPSSTAGDSLPLCIAMTLVAISSVVGVPLLNSICPLGGYLYSRAYTHGRPNTGRVALCVNFRDLPKNGRGGDDIMDALRKRNKTDDRTAATAVLNVFVTSEDIARFPNELKAIAGRGHAIGLTLAESDEGSFCHPSIFGGGRAVRDLRIAHREYARLFGEREGPSWMLSRSASSMGRHPSVLREASDLGMKVAYWSMLVLLTTDRLTSEQKIAISGDCSDKNGGSILYVTLGKGVSSNSVSGSLCELIDTLDGRYSLESLSDVARDDAEMVLKR
ncbi:hypothetical protein ACHAW5_009715 [Stephanodiscus triporus]|uniref:Uncharacterized protein n=1 Tax=Stephanodiscus triporus TaxID=2934178 RepID=A0ABD3MV45_9STRA